jgi:hypothetical protein
MEADLNAVVAPFGIHMMVKKKASETECRVGEKNKDK